MQHIQEDLCTLIFKAPDTFLLRHIPFFGNKSRRERNLSRELFHFPSRLDLLRRVTREDKRERNKKRQVPMTSSRTVALINP